MFVFAACDDMLDITPPSSISPENYLTEESQLTAYAIERYGQLPESGGGIPYDNATDNAAGMSYSNLYTDGDRKVDERAGAWNFEQIYQLNYFLETVLPRYENDEISGNISLIEHAIGEIYLLRGVQYYYKLTSLGDCPILDKVYADDFDALVKASERKPRTEVARFILDDLEKAYNLMQEQAPDGRKNRLSKPVAKLFRSRVALYEATWLKYFKGTAFVPNGDGWPGATKDYNKGYQFPSGSIDSEIEYFLKEAMQDADYVASRFDLTPNTGVIIQGDNDENPYLSMFSADNMSSYEEILLWRDFDFGLGVAHNRPVNAGTSNEGVGLTRSMMQSFLMNDGLPYYASALYQGDDHNTKIIADRDDRIRLFLKIGGQQMLWKNIGQSTHGVEVEPMLPNVIDGSPQFRYNTGYTCRKYWLVTGDHARLGNWQGDNGVHIFRAAEAYLNYMEASYELTGSIDGKADLYWKKLRARANVDTDYTKAIMATDMAKEAELDWAAYSAGQVLTDATLFNIRRERRNELLSEGFRLNDLKRWRSMDQMMTQKYHVEGFKVWNSDYSQEYIDAGYVFVHDGSSEANISSPSKSDYIRPYEIMTTNRAYNGYEWHMAHYLDPIAIQHFIVTSNVGIGGDYADSPIYQNPYWPLMAGDPALK